MRLLVSLLSNLLLLVFSLDAQNTFYDHYDLGLKYSNNRQYQKAIVEFKNSIALDSFESSKKRTYGVNFIAYHPFQNIGICYYNLGNADLAIAYLKHSFRQNPTEITKKYLRLSNDLIQKGDLAKNNVDIYPPELNCFDCGLTEVIYTSKNEYLLACEIKDENELDYFSVNGLFIPITNGNRISHTINLKKGFQKVIMEASDVRGNLLRDTLIFMRDGDAPSVVFDDPDLRRGRVLLSSEKQLVISGIITDDSPLDFISIGNDTIQVLDNGKFKFTIHLSVGENHFSFKAVDKVKNVRNIALVIEYFPSDFEISLDEKADSKIINSAQIRSGKSQSIDRGKKNSVKLPIPESNRIDVKSDKDITRNQVSITSTQVENILVDGHNQETGPPTKPSHVNSDMKGPVILVSNPVFADRRVIEVDSKDVLIQGRAFDENSGLYDLLFNDEDVPVSSDGSFQINAKLRLGENNFILTASDVKENSTDFQFTLIRKTRDLVVGSLNQMEKGVSGDPFGIYHACLIYIDDYKNSSIPSLGGEPKKDAEHLLGILTSHYSFDRENVTLLENPSRKQILQSLYNYNKSLGPEDNLLIFYAGHGFYDKENELGYWLPKDADVADDAEWIPNEVIKNNILKIKTKHTLLITDACFGGSIFKERDVTLNSEISNKESALRQHNILSRRAITSGSLEKVPMRSVFFRYLARELESNVNPYLSAGQLFRAIETPILNNSNNVPQYGVIHGTGDEGGDFIFVRKK